MKPQKSLLICLFASAFSISSFAQTYPAQPGAQAGQPQNTPTRKGTTESTTPSAQSQESDPLSFYRKNPELMQRYFPHLAQGAGAQSPTGGTSGMMQPGQVRGAFSFPGGTAKELVEALKKNFDPAPNVIVPPKLKDTPVPEFELQNVTLADMFLALNSLSEDKSVHWQLSGSSEPIWVLNPVEDANAAAGPQTGFPGARYGRVSGMMPSVDPLTGIPINPGPTCQILPVGKYLKQYKIEDITTAVKTAWSMMGDDAGAKMKYHTDTKLLIVVGTPEQLGVLTQVLASLEANPENESLPASNVDSPKNKATKVF